VVERSTVKKAWRTWCAFSVCLAMVLAAMAWVTHRMLKLEAMEAQSRRVDQVEEAVRLALWRMESRLYPLILEESLWPVSQVSSVVNTLLDAPGAALAAQADAIGDPAAFLERKPEVLLYFEVAPDGKVTSPQAPAAEPGEPQADAVPQAAGPDAPRQRLLRLAARLDLPRLREELRRPAEAPRYALVADAPTPSEQMTQRAEQQRLGNIQRNAREWEARSSVGKIVQTQQAMTNDFLGCPPAAAQALAVSPMRGLWNGGELLLARRVVHQKLEFIQGCWLNWEMLRPALLHGIEDLLPAARLEPVDNGEAPSPRRLTALPVELIPGDIAGLTPGADLPVRLPLALAWASVLVAAAAVAVLLFGAFALSERRGAFVSAVTHELRTPLTTFRMYTEMLDEGMVPEEKRRRYLTTLRGEADRLEHMVENVLAFARLEKGRAASRIELHAAGEIVETLREQLESHARRSGRELVVDVAPAACQAAARADLAAAAQILVNLVDNACKHASRAEDRRIHLEAALNGAFVELRLSDHGPGVSPEVARRLFKPFAKSAEEAAVSAPGVGLGLALSRRLARAMGGELILDPAVKDGACFVLRLPLADA
jgi:signal transduction histidine kinase